MSDLLRISMSLEKSLLDRLERLVKAGGYNNRSEYIRDMIRERLVEQEWHESRQDVLATVTVVYDHHTRELTNKLIEIQHDHHANILATTHVHLSHHLCAEMTMVKGSANEVRELTNRLRRQRGVLHAALSMTSTGKALR
jgi:CopG family nickel-responsive transcriptional regulator